MRLKIEGLVDELSAVRGIGRYNETLKEAILTYGRDCGLSLDQVSPEINLITSFNPFIRLELDQNLFNVLVIHDLIPQKYPQYFPTGFRARWIWWQNKRKIRALSGILTDSQQVKKEIHKELGISLDKIMVLPVATLSLFERAAKDKPRSSHEKYLLYVGDITWNKNLPRLARAIKQTKQILVLVGSALDKREQLGHPWFDSFREFLEITKNDPQFRFMGYVTDKELLSLYKGATAVIQPSIDEGFGYPWLEAALLGVPTIIGQNKVSEEITDGATIFVDPQNTNSIVEGINKVANRPQLDLIIKQKKRAENFSQREFIVKLSEALYNFTHVG